MHIHRPLAKAVPASATTKMGMSELIDLSVNETLPRTVMTSLTIMLALASLLIFGGHVLQGFTAAMMLGIVVGTYSSVYVSSSLLITLGLKPGPREDKPNAASGAERSSGSTALVRTQARGHRLADPEGRWCETHKPGTAARFAAASVDARTPFVYNSA